MTTPYIRATVMCIFRNDGRILVSRSFDSVAVCWYVRPLGGGIRFGETSHHALVREIREELGAEIAKVHLLGTLENIFTLNGKPRHEIVFVYDAVFVDHSLYGKASLERLDKTQAAESTVEWMSLSEVGNGEVQLVPDGLIALLDDSEDK